MKSALIQKRKYHKGKKSEGLSKLTSTSLALDIPVDILSPTYIPKFKEYNILINWGLTNIPWLNSYINDWYSEPEKDLFILNNPAAVGKACNKSIAFKHMEEGAVRIPKFTTDIEIAKSWFNIPNSIVFCRVLVSSFQGRGIVVATREEELVPAPLYTLRCPKKWEYRIHIAFDKVIRVQQKKRLNEDSLKSLGIENNNGLIRSYNNGYRFSTNTFHNEDSEVSNEMKRQALLAVSSLDLHFGAVDVAVSKKGKVTVLEVNTAPGIDGDTVLDYSNAFKRFIECSG